MNTPLGVRSLSANRTNIPRGVGRHFVFAHWALLHLGARDMAHGIEPSSSLIRATKKHLDLRINRPKKDSSLSVAIALAIILADQKRKVHHATHFRPLRRASIRFEPSRPPRRLLP